MASQPDPSQARAEDRGEEPHRASICEQVVNAVPLALLVLDGRLRVLMLNPRFAELVPRAGTVGRGQSVTDVLPKRLRERHNLLGRMRQVARDGGHFELRGVELDRHPQPNTVCDLRVSSIHRGSPEVSAPAPRVLLVIDDVMEQRALEEKMHQRAKLESLGALAGGVAHDFNNLLTGVLGFAEIALGKLPEDSPARGAVQHIVDLGQRGARLTRQILAFGRRQHLHPSAANLNEILRGALDMVRRTTGADIRVAFHPADDLGSVRADPGQIEQVLMNFAANARDAMPEGGQFTIETANVFLDDAYARDHVGVSPGPYVRITVSDTGCGMDRETLERVFEPFFTTKGREHGTGLGLSSVYGIVKQHGGNVWVYSETGHGTVFKVYLPRVAAEPDQPPKRPPHRHVGVGQKTILVVDDDASVRTVIGRVLEEQGHTVITAGSAEEAKRAAAERGRNIDLLVTDVYLEEATGPALYQALAVRVPALKVLYMSGYTDRTGVLEGRLQPGDPFIEKPFTPTALKNKIGQVLGTAA